MPLLSATTRQIGGTSFPAIGYGAMGLSAYYGSPLPDEERLKLLDAVYASGVRHWDTADIYNDNEELLGKWFKRSGKRDEIFLASKFGLAHGDPSRTVKADPEYVPKALERSLERLGVSYVDLYYLHRADKDVPIELTIQALAKLVLAGKIKNIGLSEVNASTLRRAHAVHPIAALQVEYSPFTTDIESNELLNTARELGVQIVAYAPLGRGLITGKYKGPEDFAEDDYRRSIPRYSKKNFPNILKIADGLKQVGEKYGANAGQISIAWLLAQGNDIIPIVGTTKVSNLEDNLGALKVQLTPEDVEEVRKYAEAANAAVGDRYPPSLLYTLYIDTPPLSS